MGCGGFTSERTYKTASSRSAELPAVQITAPSHSHEGSIPSKPPSTSRQVTLLHDLADILYRSNDSLIAPLHLLTHLFLKMFMKTSRACCESFPAASRQTSFRRIMETVECTIVFYQRVNRRGRAGALGGAAKPSKHVILITCIAFVRNWMERRSACSGTAGVRRTCGPR